MDAAGNGLAVAGAPELEAFQHLPAAERRLTEPLRGVLAEVATTGRIRYPWSLLRPLVMFVIDSVVLEYEEASAVEVGPSRPLPHDESVPAMLDRFRSYCWAFEGAPWTLQRLCEVLLQPQKQYVRLHKLALALEKLLLVTSEVAVSEGLPPPPLLSELGSVNDNPPKPQLNNGARLAGSKRLREEEGVGMGMAAATLDIRPLPEQAPSKAQRSPPGDGSGSSSSNSSAQETVVLATAEEQPVAAAGPDGGMQQHDEQGPEQRMQADGPRDVSAAGQASPSGQEQHPQQDSNARQQQLQLSNTSTCNGGTSLHGPGVSVPSASNGSQASSSRGEAAVAGSSMAAQANAPTAAEPSGAPAAGSHAADGPTGVLARTGGHAAVLVQVGQETAMQH